MLKRILIAFLALVPSTLGVSSKSTVESKAIEAAQSKIKFLEPIPGFPLKSDEKTNENAINMKAKADETTEENENLSDEERYAMKEAKRNAAIKAQGEKEKALVKMWFTWGFWRLLVACAVCLLVFTELIFPIVFMLAGRTLLVAAITWFCQNLAFLLTSIAFVTVNAAGAKLCLVLSVVLCAIAFLLLLGAISLKFGKTTPSMEILQTDLTYIFRPISIFVILFLIVQGLLDSSSSDWGKLTLLVSMLTLGIAFAVSGLVADVMSYCFIRGNDYFKEGEFIMNDGELLQVKHIFWCYTYAYRPSTRSDVFIPNSALAGQGINNRSRDNARTFDIDLDCPLNSNAQATKIVQDVLAMLQKSEKEGFTATNGKKFEGQIDVSKSVVYITGVDPAGGACTLKIKLFGKYYFSKPPQWKMDSPEPQWSARQMEWQAGWNYQMEWILLESQKIISKNKA